MNFSDYKEILPLLIEGKNGLEQPKKVKKHLMGLESVGLIEHKNGKWYLSSVGRMLVDE